MITLKLSTLVRVASLALAALSGSAIANQHPHPHKGSLDYLDRNGYAKNMRVLGRSEEHTSELQSPCNLVCRLLLEKKKKQHDHWRRGLARHVVRVPSRICGEWGSTDDVVCSGLWGSSATAMYTPVDSARSHVSDPD